jgi:hypothetical protein
MTEATVACEQCTRAVPTESAVYSSTGKLLCKTCLAATQYVEIDARGAASRRRTQIALGVTLALLVVVPGAMFALGLGQIVAHTLVGLGLVCLFGGNSARRMFVVRNRNADPTVVRGTVFLMLGGAVALCAGGLLEGRF